MDKCQLCSARRRRDLENDNVRRCRTAQLEARGSLEVSQKSHDDDMACADSCKRKRYLSIRSQSRTRTRVLNDSQKAKYCTLSVLTATIMLCRFQRATYTSPYCPAAHTHHTRLSRLIDSVSYTYELTGRSRAQSVHFCTLERLRLQSEALSLSRRVVAVAIRLMRLILSGQSNDSSRKTN